MVRAARARGRVTRASVARSGSSFDELRTNRTRGTARTATNVTGDVGAKPPHNRGGWAGSRAGGASSALNPRASSTLRALLRLARRRRRTIAAGALALTLRERTAREAA